MVFKDKEKVEVTVVTTVELDPSDETTLPASPDIAKRRRTFLRAKSWKTWRDTAREDIKSMRWIRALMWTLIAAWTLALLLAIGSLSLLGAGTMPSEVPEVIRYFLEVFGLGSSLEFFGSRYRGSTACQPNGGFSMYPDSYEWWSMGDFFEITIGFRSLSFTEVKLIDVVAGIVFGRLGQAIAGYVSWRVFADYLTTSMAARPATYTTFWVVFLHREPSLAAWLRLIREFWRGGVLNSKIAMGFMSLTMLFVISIPTLTNSMTGYTPTFQAFVRTQDPIPKSSSSNLVITVATKGGLISPRPDSSLTLFATFQETLYVIHDGSRVGLDDGYAIPVPNGNWKSFGGGPMIDTVISSWMCNNCTSSDPQDVDCIRANVSSYVQQHGFNGLDNTPSIFMSKELPAPALNVSTSFIPGNRRANSWSSAWLPNTTQQDNCWGTGWTDPRTGYQPARDPQNRHYHDSFGRVYPLKYVQGSGVCQPAVEHCPGSDDDLCTVQKYLWGFSYIQLFLNLLLYLLWTIGLYIMWLKSQAQLPLKGAPEVPRGWRALIHLGEAMRRDLDRRGTDPEKLTDRQLKTVIRKQLNGGAIAFQEPLQQPGLGIWTAFQSWSRKQNNIPLIRWSIGVGLAALVINLIGWGIQKKLEHTPALVFAVVGYILTFVFVGMLWAMALGRTKTSRALFIFLWSTVAPVTLFGIKRRSW
ncbi:hypothetical protein QBC34DRAFT_496606 [Podospora aff. communis PSN243]|uniref:Uncharacterized protein n=1 Tax=Podospora aff. communis PSN243 TaxID=3040156 RepID=A0AAV9GEB2_9PEZI|nr:hypothetical protein QBC34DRAFT_496606 [Podospora aff. communis PSN243]